MNNQQPYKEELLVELDKYLNSISDEEFEQQISKHSTLGVKVDDFFCIKTTQPTQ